MRRIFLYAAPVLASLAACTPEGGRAPDASPPTAAPPTAALAAPVTTIPAPSGTAPATDKLAYMPDHIAKDAALEQALIGSWVEPETIDGETVEGVVTYAADHSVTFMYQGKTAALTSKWFQGVWSIQHGFLTYSLTVAENKVSGSDEILRIDARQFVYVDSNDKKTKIATRRTGASPSAAAPSTASLSAAAPVTTAPAAIAAEAQIAPVAAAAPMATDGTLLADETLFVAKEDTQAYVVRLTDTAQIRLTVEIGEKVPVNVVFQRGRVSPEDYMMNLGVLLVSQVFSTLDDGKDKKLATFDDLFSNRLSKRAAYGRFASPWVTVNPGTYTIILDNSGQLSPTRGDAPVHVLLYRRPAS